MRMTPHFEPHPMFTNNDALLDRACEDDPHATLDGFSSRSSPVLTGEVSAPADGGGLPNHHPHPLSSPALADEVSATTERSDPLLSLPAPRGEVSIRQRRRDGGVFPTTNHTPLSSPGLTGEVSAPGGRRVSSSPPSPSPLHPSGQSLVASPLFQDLLDPTNTPLQICLIHDITLDQLEAIVTSTAFKHAAAQLQTITSARTEAIDSNTHLQTQSLQRAIAQDAYLAAADMDQATTARDPKRAAIKARFLETARKANTPLGARTRGKAAQCGDQSTPPIPQHHPPQPSSPIPMGEVGSAQPRSEGALPTPSPSSSGCHHSPQRGAVVPPNTIHLSSPALAGEVSAQSAFGGEGASCPSPRLAGRCRSAKGGATEGSSPTTNRTPLSSPGLPGEVSAHGGRRGPLLSLSSPIPMGEVPTQSAEGATLIPPRDPPLRTREVSSAVRLWRRGGLPLLSPIPYLPSNPIRYCS